MSGLDLSLAGVELRSGGRVLVKIAGLALRAGQSLAIQGPSGAGKSTLLALLAGLIRPDVGQVVWGDTDLAQGNDAARTAFRARHIGMIFQDFLLFEELDALGNASLAASFAPAAERPHIKSRAAAALIRLGLPDTGNRRVDSFSGGERQRIAIARALANDPAILLADEPTASLDRTNADRLIADLAALGSEGRSLIAVTHDAALAERLDRRLTLRDGQIVEDSHG